MQFVDLHNKISVAELATMSHKMFGGQLVKAVVDIDKNIMVVDAAFHCDQELLLLEEHDSQQDYLWGINLHPDQFGKDDWIEFDSMINFKQDNRTRGVDNPIIQKKIREIVNTLVIK